MQKIYIPYWKKKDKNKKYFNIDVKQMYSTYM